MIPQLIHIQLFCFLCTNAIAEYQVGNIYLPWTQRQTNQSCWFHEIGQPKIHDRVFYQFLVIVFFILKSTDIYLTLFYVLLQCPLKSPLMRRTDTPDFDRDVKRWSYVIFIFHWVYKSNCWNTPFMLNKDMKLLNCVEHMFSLSLKSTLNSGKFNVRQISRMLTIVRLHHIIFLKTKKHCFSVRYM